VRQPEQGFFFIPPCSITPHAPRGASLDRPSIRSNRHLGLGPCLYLGLGFVTASANCLQRLRLVVSTMGQGKDMVNLRSLCVPACPHARLAQVLVPLEDLLP